VHQRINQHVFREPDKVMENIQRVTQYASQQILAAGGDPRRETLQLVPTRDGLASYRTPNGDTWRTYAFIEGARTYDIAENLQQVYAAANAFGRFQVLLNDLPGPRLHETIPNFHHTRQRFEAFLRALQNDPANRASEAAAEIEFLRKREADASVVVDLLAEGKLPERVTHNDTKLNNVLIDDQSGEGICVIDLDTTMPGSALYDFGDLIRMGTATAGEDERDLARVDVDLRLFEELTRGYLDATRSLLTPLEWDMLAFAGRLITFEQALRFLGDYLNGDIYYKTKRPGQNLDRARTQIKMLAEMERKQADMERILRKYR
jgi:aminoglycoside phosphotransferase (APT) family kinase protein